jgi:SAM-dependent methyltransferase
LVSFADVILERLLSPNYNVTDQLSSNPKRDLFGVSALFLFLELAFIRWFPSEVLFLTFFTNTVLLASFLGLSLGCLAAGHRRNYLVWTPVLLIVGIACGAAMESVRLALQDILDVGKNVTSPQMVYFGTEVRVNDVASFAVPIEWVAGFFFLLIALTMIGPGQVLGRRFAAVPNPVQAYIANIGGSLAGVLLFNLCSWWLSPVWWFGIAAAGIVYFLLRDAPRQRWAMVLAVAAPLLLLLPEHFELGVIRKLYPQEAWSPYYRVNYSSANHVIVVNLLGHQTMIGRTEPAPSYALPYLLNRDSGQSPFHDILIIGAGSGNDVSRALQWGAPDVHIDAVEIDPVIQRLGSRDHPDRPYQDPRVTVHLGDGRNFLRSTDKKYDLIVFALVDSLVLHSSVSNIRLESYLFTRESIADVQRRLKPGGLFVLYNYFRQGWIVSRLTKTLGDVFGQTPEVLTMPEQDLVLPDRKFDSFTAFFAGPRAEAIRAAFGKSGNYLIPSGAAPVPSWPDGFNVPPGKDQIRFHPANVLMPADLRVAEDVWPFLYLREPMIPDLSWRGIAVIGAITLALLWLFAGRTDGSFGGLDARMLLLGAGFMLLETKAVVHAALLYGSTWIVNTMVFSAILVMILGANLWVLIRQPRNLTVYYAGLLVALALNVALPLDAFLGWPSAAQGIAAGLLLLSPVFCAGVIFAVLFKTAGNPVQALAFNTAGAILGGLTENTSLLIGFKWLLAVAAVIYIGSWIVPSLNRSSEMTQAATVD